ncbi:MAG: V-type ATP synthase subunit D [Ruminococcaceae bacterium]|nr:V-type ATP synthase subunit D [Oscillospiraceae bacterium]
MAEIRVNPTRMELKKLQARYQTARRGHKLLKDKRDELMRRFLEVVKRDKELRLRVEAALQKAYARFDLASAVTHPKMLEESLLLPKKQSELRVDYRNQMSVTVPDFSIRESTVGGSDAYNYGLAFTSGELDSALFELGNIRRDLLTLSAVEKEAQLLAEEIERTRRRVNALEHIMMPRYLTAIRAIKMKLDENERGNITRLMKVKDMMIAAQYKDHQEEDPADAV